MTVGLCAGETTPGNASAQPLATNPYNDERAVIILNTGQNPQNAEGSMVCRVKLAAWNGIGAVLLQPHGFGQSEAAGFHTKNVTADSFEIWAATQLAFNTQYQLQYFVMP